MAFEGSARSIGGAQAGLLDQPPVEGKGCSNMEF